MRDIGHEYREEAKCVLSEVSGFIDERVGTHPDPRNELSAIGRMWGSLLGIGAIPPEKVALLLICLKVARAWEKPDHEDNFLDIAGYAAIGCAHVRLEKSNVGHASR